MKSADDPFVKMEMNVRIDHVHGPNGSWFVVRPCEDPFRAYVSANVDEAIALCVQDRLGFEKRGG